MVRKCVLIFSLLVAFSCGDRPKSEGFADAERSWPDSLYVKAGDQVISKTFDTLRNSLLSAIQSKGLPEAIEFCNEKADVLTSIYSDSVTVRRTALRYRNPANRPDSLETRVLQAWQGEMTAGRKLQAAIFRDEGKVHYLKPILMQAMCMNCHGAPQKNIQPNTLAAIRKHYPGDLAVDFEEGELRGSWHLIFGKRP